MTFNKKTLFTKAPAPTNFSPISQATGVNSPAETFSPIHWREGAVLPPGKPRLTY